MSRTVREGSVRAPADDAGVDVVHDLDADGTVEHERQPVERLLVAAHQRQEFVGVEPGRWGDHQVVLARHDPAVLVDAGLIDAAEFARQFGGEDQPDRHRLTVREVVVGGDLEGVGQRVAVVEQRPPAAFALVGRHDLGLDLDAAGDPIGEVQASRSSPVRKWYLAISPSPQRISRAGSVSSASRSQITPDGCQNAPTRFLPSGQVDGGLAADGRIDHPEQRGRRRAPPACRDASWRRRTRPRR